MTKDPIKLYFAPPPMEPNYAAVGVFPKLVEAGLARNLVVHYREADVLYVKFKQSRIVDNKPLDEKGLTLASLDEKGEVVGLIIMETSKLARDVAKTR